MLVTTCLSLIFVLSSAKKSHGLWAVWETACCAVFQATCGRVLCVHRRGTVHALFAGLVDKGSRRLGRLRVRVRTEPPDPRDCLGLQHAEAVLPVVPRFGLDVQLERTAAAPTPWTRPFSRKPAVGVIGSLRSVSPVIAGTRTARSGVARPHAGARSRPRVNGTAGVRKAGSIIAITNARIARA